MDDILKIVLAIIFFSGAAVALQCPNGTAFIHPATGSCVSCDVVCKMSSKDCLQYPDCKAWTTPMPTDLETNTQKSCTDEGGNITTTCTCTDERGNITTTCGPISINSDTTDNKYWTLVTIIIIVASLLSAVILVQAIFLVLCYQGKIMCRNNEQGRGPRGSDYQMTNTTSQDGNS